MNFLPILILSIFYSFIHCDLKILPLNVKNKYDVPSSGNVLKSISLSKTSNNMKNIRRIRKFKCVELIEIIDMDTGDIIDEQIVRKVKPKFVVSKKKYEGKSLTENVKKDIIIATTFTTTLFPDTSEIKIFHRKNPKHLSNGQLFSKNLTDLDKLIERKYFESRNIDNIRNRKMDFTKNEYDSKKYLNYEDFIKRWINKSINTSETVHEEHKKVHNTSGILIPFDAFSKNYSDSTLILLKNDTKNNFTSLNKGESKDKMYQLPESPPYIPYRPVKYNYPTENDYMNNYKTRLYAKSDYKKINTENEATDKNILFTTPTPLITPSFNFMNHAPLVKQNQYIPNISKQRKISKGDSSNSNLTMTKENCNKMNSLAKTFSISDVQKWIRNNCIFARFYLPQATCQDIYTFVDSCYKKFFF
uniref:Ground-like domain-containing protein n=1 Tax=Strongyloides venezuelensis TaxID=75913 RepID=A0A0K0FE12_STRVS